jgi:ketol-acid reductoisomerase
MKIYRETDLQTNTLENARVAVLGYGNQGHAHAMNLRDSGVDVVIGAREGRGRRQAADHGFEPVPIAEAVGVADYVVVLLPDEIQEHVFTKEIGPNLKSDAALVFAHGFSIAFGVIEPPAGHDVLLVAPKGQGHYVRKLYVEKKGLPCLVAAESDASGKAHDKTLSYAHALGCLRAGAIETTFREEAVTDLFGEQTVLCGGVPALVKAGDRLPRMPARTENNRGFDVQKWHCPNAAEDQPHGGMGELPRRGRDRLRRRQSKDGLDTGRDRVRRICGRVAGRSFDGTIKTG